MDITIERRTPKFINQSTVSPARAQIGKEYILQVQDDFTEEEKKSDPRHNTCTSCWMQHRQSHWLLDATLNAAALM